MFLAQAMSADQSCQSAANQAPVQRLVEGLKPCSINTGGYCKARQHRLHFEYILCRLRHIPAVLRIVFTHPELKIAFLQRMGAALDDHQLIATLQIYLNSRIAGDISSKLRTGAEEQSRLIPTPQTGRELGKPRLLVEIQ